MSRLVQIGLVVACGVGILLVVRAVRDNGDSTTTTSAAAASVTPAEQWADAVCTSVITWKHNVRQAASSVKQNPSKETLSAALTHAQTWTQTLVDKLKSLGPPPSTTAGSQARSTLDGLAKQLHDGSAAIKSEVKGISGAKGSVESASVVSTTLVTMRDQVRAAGNDLRALPKGELKQAFTSSKACHDLSTETAT